MAIVFPQALEQENHSCVHDTKMTGHYRKRSTTETDKRKIMVARLSKRCQRIHQIMDHVRSCGRTKATKAASPESNAF